MSTAQKADIHLHKTPLWATHLAHGGKMVGFAGYDMPVQYDGMGVLKEHLHTRQNAALFDVSHMGQAVMRSKDDPAVLLEKLVPGDIAGLTPGQMRYTLLLNDQGGIIDDLIVTRRDANTLFLIVNAACKEKDFAHIHAKLPCVLLEQMDDRALLALQGPKAETVLSTLISAVKDMSFMTSITIPYKGYTLYISRSGYTGEDGYEISIPEAFTIALTQELLSHDEVKWAGLGARDSLRLEAGLCLYGHDIDDTTTPVEANLKWTIPKRRRSEGGFPGAEKILSQLKDGAPRLRVGIRPEGRAPVREGTEIFSLEGKKIGVITSGGFGPSVDAPVAMGYVQAAYAPPGTKINAMLRGTVRPCEVATLPFVKPNYKRETT